MPKTTKPKDDGKTYYDTVRVKMPVPKTTKPKKKHRHKLFPHYNLGLFICINCGKFVSL